MVAFQLSDFQRAVRFTKVEKNVTNNYLKIYNIYIHKLM